MKYTIVPVHISSIRRGDTVSHDGHLKTVCLTNLKREFGEVTLFGDSYRLGTLPVLLARIERAIP